MQRSTVRTVLSSCLTLLVAVPTLGLIFSLVACKEAAVALGPAGPADVPTQLTFLGGPTNAIAGAALTPGVRVAILDAQGNTVATATTSVTLTIGTNSAGGSLSGTVTESAVYGVATFSNLSINKADTGYTLSASAAGVSGATSTTFSVTAGTASKLAFTAQPATTMAGLAIPAVAVAVQDALGNTVTTSTTNVALTIGTNTVGGTLSGTATIAAIGGVATFSNLSVNIPGTGFTLSASATSLTGAMSTPFSSVVVASSRVIARESLATVDGGPLPCCVIDSAGARVSIVSGVLTFYMATYYPDSMPTPGGWAPRACVQLVPNGAVMHGNGVVTLPDGSTYILLGCSWGAYGLTLSQQLGSSTMLNEATVSAGAFTWKRDTLTIADPQLGGPLSPSASMAGATITVIVRGHSYQFVAIAVR